MTVSTVRPQHAESVQWSERAWHEAAPDAISDALAVGDRLLRRALYGGSADELLTAVLPEIAAELAAQWVAVLRRVPHWTAVCEVGRSGGERPDAFLAECLDRGTAGLVQLDRPAGWSVLAVPLAADGLPDAVLAAGGRNVSRESLVTAQALARSLSLTLEIARRVDRLQSVLRSAATFAAARETGPLLELIAREATRLLNCDRASIFIWDRDRKEVVACPALGVEGGTLRLPDNRGIVGEVLHTRETIRVGDAYADSRFDKRIDKQSGYRTRNLLCVPLYDGEGALVGAFEVINKNDGVFADDDEETLSELAVHAANAVLNARERDQLVRSRTQLTEQLTRGVQIVGESPAIVALRSTIERLAATDLPVLILGQSGTGKEVVAQALHYRGPRAENPFIAVNCAALTETLLESELFGHEKGAFTDAHEARQGKFELAEGGTIFLDEIGDMSPAGQAKLLRVLEQKLVTRVGGSQPIPINVRVIAATNANLPERVRDKKFREDLYYRLSVVTQTLPPLSERPEDILPLAEYFLEEFCRQAGRPTPRFSAEARRRLQAHSWPGNVRELRNLMERVAFLSAGKTVEADELAFILSPGQDKEKSLEPSPDFGLAEATKEFQQAFIRKAIGRVKGRMSEAARLLGLHRSNLYRKMRQLGMSEAEDDQMDD